MSNNLKDISSQYFKTFMRFRKQTMVEIAEHTGISKRTLQGYAQGKPPFRKAAATNFIAITDYMEIDPHYMLGLENWKISEYLENICNQYNLKSLSEVATLPETVRLTKATRKYRAEKKEKRRLRKTSFRIIRKNSKGTITNHPCDLYSPLLDVTMEYKNKNNFTEGSWRETEARMRAYMEAFKKIENGDEPEIQEWLL